MDLQEHVTRQADAGYTHAEIIKDLKQKGFAQTDIEKELALNQTVITESNKSNTKSIIIGVLFVIVAMVRLARFVNTGSALAGIGILTAVILAIVYFTKRN